MSINLGSGDADAGLPLACSWTLWHSDDSDGVRTLQSLATISTVPAFARLISFIDAHFLDLCGRQDEVVLDLFKYGILPTGGDKENAGGGIMEIRLHDVCEYNGSMPLAIVVRLLEVVVAANLKHEANMHGIELVFSSLDRLRVSIWFNETLASRKDAVSELREDLVSCIGASDGAPCVSVLSIAEEGKSEHHLELEKPPSLTILHRLQLLNWDEGHELDSSLIDRSLVAAELRRHTDALFQRWDKPVGDAEGTGSCICTSSRACHATCSSESTPLATSACSAAGSVESIALANTMPACLRDFHAHCRTPRDHVLDSISTNNLPKQENISMLTAQIPMLETGSQGRSNVLVKEEESAFLRGVPSSVGEFGEQMDPSVFGVDQHHAGKWKELEDEMGELLNGVSISTPRPASVTSIGRNTVTTGLALPNQELQPSNIWQQRCFVQNFHSGTEQPLHLGSHATCQPQRSARSVPTQMPNRARTAPSMTPSIESMHFMASQNPGTCHPAMNNRSNSVSSSTLLPSSTWHGLQPSSSWEHMPQQPPLPPTAYRHASQPMNSRSASAQSCMPSQPSSVGRGPAMPPSQAAFQQHAQQHPCARSAGVGRQGSPHDYDRWFAGTANEFDFDRLATFDHATNPNQLYNSRSNTVETFRSEGSCHDSPHSSPNNSFKRGSQSKSPFFRNQSPASSYCSSSPFVSPFPCTCHRGNSSGCLLHGHNAQRFGPGAQRDNFNGNCFQHGDANQHTDGNDFASSNQFFNQGNFGDSSHNGNFHPGNIATGNFNTNVENAGKFSRANSRNSNVSAGWQGPQNGSARCSPNMQTRGFQPGAPEALIPDRVAANLELKRMQAQQQWRESRQLMQLMGCAGIPADVGRYNALILWYKKNKQWGEALAVLSEMKAAGTKPSIVSFNSAIDACGKAKQLKTAFDMLEHVHQEGLSPDTVTYTSLIDACGKSQQLERAFSVLAQMKSVGVRPNSFTYNALIDACAKAAEVDRAFDVLAQMVHEGIQPNTTTYTALIDACGKAQQLERAFLVLHKMQLENIKPNTATYTCLVDACGKAQQLERAFEILRLMQDANVQANTHTYNALIDACGKARQLERAFGVLRDMQRNGVRPDAVSYTCLIDACGRSLQIERAMEVVQQMQQAGHRPNTAAFTSLIDACDKAMEVDRAFQVLSYMRQIGVSPNTVTFTSLIDACGRTQKIDQAFELFEQMQQMGVMVNAATFATLINACAKCGELDRAMMVLEQMHTSNVNPDTNIYNALISTCSRSNQLSKAFELLNQMKKFGIQPNSASYNALVDVCCKCGDLAAAEATISQMQTEGIFPDASTFNMLLYACCKYQQPERVFSTLSMMRQMRAVPNAATMNTLASNFTGDRSQLDKVLVDLFS